MRRRENVIISITNHQSDFSLFWYFGKTNLRVSSFEFLREKMIDDETSTDHYTMA